MHEPQPRPTRTNNGVPNGTYPIPKDPAPVYEVGMWVALYHNPTNAHRITAIDGDRLTCQRSASVITVETARVKPLIPQKKAVICTD